MSRSGFMLVGHESCIRKQRKLCYFRTYHLSVLPLFEDRDAAEKKTKYEDAPTR